MFRTRERVGEEQRGKAINQKFNSCLGFKNFIFQFRFGDSDPQEVEHITEATSSRSSLQPGNNHNVPFYNNIIYAASCRQMARFNS